MATGRRFWGRINPFRVRNGVNAQLHPMQLRPGDQVTEADGEWVVVGRRGIHGGSRSSGTS